jgi:hypothetical protein
MCYMPLCLRSAHLLKLLPEHADDSSNYLQVTCWQCCQAAAAVRMLAAELDRSSADKRCMC